MKEKTAKVIAISKITDNHKITLPKTVRQFMQLKDENYISFWAFGENQINIEALKLEGIEP